MSNSVGGRRAGSSAPRSPCPISGALDLLGDRWTLLVMRDVLFYDKTRFADFLASSEGIASNILTDRLKRLERRGLLERRRYRDRPRREEYHATPQGADLIPVLRALLRWGQRYAPGTAGRPPAGVSKRTLKTMGIDSEDASRRRTRRR